MVDEELKKMISDYMEAGFLENIIDMFRRDPSLFPLLGELISDERGRVRLGAVALAESLRWDFKEELRSVIPHIASSLKHSSPVVRADSAYLLGVIGDGASLLYLLEAEKDPDRNVSEVVSEVIKEIISLRPQADE